MASRERRRTNPWFTGFAPGCDPALVGMCIRVISPTPLKKVRRPSAVILKNRLPTQTEFFLFEGAAAEPSASFLFLESGALDSWFTPSFSFFFWRRCSACDSTGTSGAVSCSEWSESSSEGDTEDRFLFNPFSEPELLDEEEEGELILAGGSEVQMESAGSCRFPRLQLTPPEQMLKFGLTKTSARYRNILSPQEVYPIPERNL